MAINFPDAPAVNDIYTENSKTWKWNGTSWVAYNTGTQGPIGYTGSGAGGQGIAYLFGLLHSS